MIDSPTLHNVQRVLGMLQSPLVQHRLGTHAYVRAFVVTQAADMAWKVIDELATERTRVEAALGRLLATIPNDNPEALAVRELLR